MRAQRFPVSLSFTPSSAWAARPLASGARLVVIGRRACSNVGVGCPSFGGQRSDGGDSRRLLACWATGSVPRRTLERVRPIPGPSNQTARPAVNSTVGSSFAAGGRVLGRCSATRASLGHEQKAMSGSAGLTETAEYQSPMRQSRAPFTVSVESRMARSPSRGWPAEGSATPAPNHSVKGTSCGKPQAAPYLER